MNEPRIIVKPDGDEFILVNEATGGICGDRMFMGEDGKDPKQHWPFHRPRWNRYDDELTAQEAASALQRYLDARLPVLRHTLS